MFPNRPRANGFVPLSIRGKSRIVTWLWRHTEYPGWLTYDRAQWLAKRLP
jgi:hypothetical protein